MQNRQSVKDISKAVRDIDKAAAGQSVKKKDIAIPSDETQAVFVIDTASNQQASNGPYWRLVLRDATGSVEAIIWSPESQGYTELAPGKIVEILEGNASLYRKQAQIIIKQMRLLSEEERTALDMDAFIAKSPHSPDKMWDELLALCKRELTHKPWRDFVCGTLKDDTPLKDDVLCASDTPCKANTLHKGDTLRQRLLIAPAAKSIHHAYEGGLLEHTLSVVQLVLRMCDQYPALDRQTLLAAAVFHDIGKIWEYSGGIANDYTDEGRLLGHTELALEFLGPRLAKSNLDSELIRHFKHLILSHHGDPAYGAARLPQTAEAILLHFADNIDAKMAQCAALFTNGPPDAVAWSAFQRTLDRYVYQPKRTPVEISPSPKTLHEAPEQCLSLLKA